MASNFNTLGDTWKLEHWLDNRDAFVLGRHCTSTIVMLLFEVRWMELLYAWIVKASYRPDCDNRNDCSRHKICSIVVSYQFLYVTQALRILVLW
jgi:hypothetical protein